jgi:hypothetical protein
MGFDGLFFARADYREKDERKANKTLQMIWQGSGKEEGHEGEKKLTQILRSRIPKPGILNTRPACLCLNV